VIRGAGEVEMDTPVKAKPARDLRDYLAEERTFLAGVRTGIALMGFGFVVAPLQKGHCRGPNCRLPIKPKHTRVDGVTSYRIGA
jgi:hypothetical protein